MKKFVVGGLFENYDVCEFEEIRRYKRRKFAEDKIMSLPIKYLEKFHRIVLTEFDDWGEIIKIDVYKDGILIESVETDCEDSPYGQSCLY